jgi:hypothetical protein
MATDWAVKYLVLSPEGVVAHDDSVRVTDEEPVREGRAFSAGGDYYYDVYQVGNEIVLRRLTPGNRRVRIPSLDNPEAAKAEELTIGFVGSDQLFVLGIHPGNRRAGLIDLRSHVALWTQLEFPATAHPACTGRFQADRARGGELIYIGEPDSVFPDCKVYGFDVDGKLVWGRKMSGDWISPRWAVCSTDRDVAALIGNLELGIIETQTGRLLDKHEIGAQEPRKSDGGTGPPLDLWWIWEASFRDDRLTLVGQVGGGGNQPILIQATVGPNGKITSLEEHKIMMRGLAPSSLSCLVMPEEGGDTWIVAGFRK